MTRDELKHTVAELMYARAAEDTDELTRITGRITAGRMLDSHDVVGYMAAVAGAGMKLQPGETFHRLRVQYECDKGHVHQGSADDLPPPVRVFSQMAVAMANRDPRMVTDLFIGYVQRKRSRAAQLMVVGSTVLVRQAAADGVGPT